jgi:uncharacterized protein (TIGR03437 family)
MALVLLASPASWASGGLQPPATGIYLGVWANPDSATSQERAIEILEGPAPNGINRTFALHLIYLQWGDIQAMVDNNGVLQPNGALRGDINAGRVPVISWKCDQVRQNSNHLIAGGDPDEDALITASAKALAQYPGPVVLRWFWEFNLLTSNNSVANQTCLGNGGNPPTQQVYNDFIGAWQHIWRLFQNAGATNVSFLWNPGHYGVDGDAADPHGYYPGNAYVDWIGTDSYQHLTTETFADDIGLFYSDFSQSQFGGKPLMVGENGAPNIAINNAEIQQAYLQSVLSAVQSNRYPLLKAYDYFSATDIDKTSNWILDAGGVSELAILGASSAFNVPPVLTAGSVANGATYAAGGLVPGSWAQVKGTQLGNVVRIWNAADFTGLGNGLPSNLSGVQVTVNGAAASVYYISPTQISFQVPNGVSGNAAVQVMTNGVASNSVTAAAAAVAPGIFPVIVNGTNYPAGVFLDGKYVGDPAVGPQFRKAKPGDLIQLYATGLAVTPAGVLPGSQVLTGVTVTIGNVVIPAIYAGLAAVGEFQINVAIPQQFANLAEGSYPVSIQVGSVSSPLTINSNPPGQLVIPIQH